MNHPKGEPRSRPGRPGTLCGGAMPAAICLLITAAGAAPAQPPASRPAPATMPAPTTGPAASQPATMPGGKGLLLDFRNTSLQAVLEYLSEAGGLVILNGADAEGRVTIMSRDRVSVDEAIGLLDTILKDKGFTAIRTGRLLKIVTLAQAAKENLPVQSGSDPEDVPLSDKLVTQVIPIRYAEATRLRTDLAPLIGAGATLAANEASNTLILIDTQTNIRRILQIIRAMDSHMAGVSEVKVYRLKFADATTTSRLITELFKQDQQQNQGTRVIMPFGRFEGGRGGPGGGDRGREGGGDQQGARQPKVTATADERTNTLVVSAPPEMLKLIDGVVKELDSDPTEEQSVFIYPLKNAKSTNLESVLNGIFSGSLTTTAGRTTTGGTTSSRFGGGSTGFGRGTTTAMPGGTTAAGAGDLAGQVYVIADE
ncbi:MAG TPA: secretin N-terminal domain-containing protein, partial [Phycisphaerae bacterium]|nr:secretin N-terminal domain-containing protein [Phycisphaerae bacterium]